MICKICSYPYFQEKSCPPSKIDLIFMVGIVALTILGALTQTEVIQVPYLNCAAFTGAALGLVALVGKWIYQCTRPIKEIPFDTEVSSFISAGELELPTGKPLYTFEESKGNDWRALISGKKSKTKALHIFREEAIFIDSMQMVLFAIFPEKLSDSFNKCLEKIKTFNKFNRKGIHKLMADVGEEATLVLHTESHLLISSPKCFSLFSKIELPLSGKPFFTIDQAKPESYLLFSTPEFWKRVSMQKYYSAFSKTVPSEIIAELTTLAKDKDLNEIHFLVIKAKI